MNNPPMTCKRCAKMFSHPDAYRGQCEDCFADACARDDDTCHQERKTSPGKLIQIYATNRERPNRHNKILGTAW